MRPRPSEIITGVRAVLAETVAPELTSEHAKARLGEIRAVLAQIDWDNAGFDLMARADGLTAGLREAGRHTDVELPDPPTETTAEAYEQHCEQLAAAAVVALAGLRTHLADRPGDDAARAAYRALLGSL